MNQCQVIDFNLNSTKAPTLSEKNKWAQLQPEQQSNVIAAFKMLIRWRDEEKNKNEPNQQVSNQESP